MMQKKGPVQRTGPVLYELYFQEDLDVVGIEVALTFAEVLLNFALQLFSATLDMLAGVVGGVAEVTSDLSLHFLASSFNLIFDASFI